MACRFQTLVAIGCLACQSSSRSDAESNSSTPLSTAVVDSSTKAALLEEGSPAPDVDLLLHDGRKKRLSEYQGQNVVLYFYPADDTPGCTAEAQGFRNHIARLEAARTVVVGVSTQNSGSHRAFIDKYSLPFDLVVDADGAVARAFQVPVRLGFAARQTFLIDHGGRIARVWRDVTPQGHAEEVVAVLEAFKH